MVFKFFKRRSAEQYQEEKLAKIQADQEKVRIQAEKEARVSESQPHADAQIGVAEAEAKKAVAQVEEVNAQAKKTEHRAEAVQTISGDIKEVTKDSLGVIETGVEKAAEGGKVILENLNIKSQNIQQEQIAKRTERRRQRADRRWRRGEKWEEFNVAGLTGVGAFAVGATIISITSTVALPGLAIGAGLLAYGGMRAFQKTKRGERPRDGVTGG